MPPPLARHKEIEVKWKADQVGREEFNKKLRAYLDARYMYRFVRVSGPDTYFSDESGRTVRHRISRNTHELTSKMRLNRRSILSRKEVNVKLDRKQPVSDVFEFLSMLGLKMAVPLRKSCDIYFISGPKTHLSIVWYRVKRRGKRDRVFVEVEVEGLSHKRSLAAIRPWVGRLQRMLGLRRRDVSNESLYELYTGKRYHQA